MNKLVPVIAVSAVLLLVACPYDTTFMSSIRSVAASLVDTEPGNQPLADGTCTANPVSRSYDFPCGEIRTTVCKDSADVQPNSGEMDWMLPMGHPNAKDHDCFQEASGQWCCPGYTCTWRGLDRNTGSGRGGAADCVVKWRHQTCISPGLREGKHGRVITCGNANGDTYVAAETSWDLTEEVE